MAELLDQFPKSTAGRPTRVNISYLKTLADNNPGEVVAEVLNEKDAQSVRRQFLKLRGYKVATIKHTQQGMRRVLIQRKAR